MNSLHTALLTAVVLNPAASFAARPLAYEQAMELTRAAGKVLAKQRTVEVVLNDCTSAFTPLQQSAAKARAHWQSHNADIVAQATRLHHHLLTQITQLQTTTNAEKYTEQINYLIDSNVRGIQQKLAQYPVEQRQPLCHRLMLSISAGDWDVAKALPDTQQIITRYLATQTEGR